MPRDGDIDRFSHCYENRHYLTRSILILLAGAVCLSVSAFFLLFFWIESGLTKAPLFLGGIGIAFGGTLFLWASARLEWLEGKARASHWTFALGVRFLVLSAILLIFAK